MQQSDRRREVPGRLGEDGGRAVSQQVRPEASLEVLALQRSAGNHATAALVGRLPRRPTAGAPLPRAVLQRKGPKLLMEEVAGSTTAGLLAWMTELVMKPDEHFVPVSAAIRAYDAFKDPRPGEQRAKLRDIEVAISKYEPHAPTGFLWKPNPNFVALKAIVAAEVRIVQAQLDRLERFTKDADAPYEQMTAEGALWTDPEWSLSAPSTGLNGRKYFDMLSGANRSAMKEEISGAGDQDWVEGMLQKLNAALGAAVINHYTTSSRAEMMLADKGAKSKTLLTKDSATYRHNTSAYDDFGLANIGFVFFFIEAPGEPLRQTRFGEGAKDEEPSDRARISIPIKESGLLSNGWVMLSDFAQREYPTVAAKTESPAETASHLETREKRPGYDLPVRRFQQGVGALEPEEFEALQKQMPDQQQRTAVSSVKAQVRGDEQSTMSYGAGGKANQYADRLFQNVLVGPDIIPGLAERAVVETNRIAKANPALGDRLKSMDGTQLMKFLLKDLLRPQAMVPNSVKIEERHIEREVPKKAEIEPKDDVPKLEKPKDDVPMSEKPKGDVPTEIPPTKLSSGSAPSREELVKRGLAQLNELAEAWRSRGNSGTPPGYHDRANSIRSIVMAPEHLALGALEEELAGWLKSASTVWS